MEILLQNLNQYGHGCFHYSVTENEIDGKCWLMNLGTEEAVFSGTHYELMAFLSGMIYQAESNSRSMHGKMRLCSCNNCGGLSIVS